MSTFINLTTLFCVFNFVLTITDCNLYSENDGGLPELQANVITKKIPQTILLHTKRHIQQKLNNSLWVRICMLLRLRVGLLLCCYDPPDAID